MRRTFSKPRYFYFLLIFRNTVLNNFIIFKFVLENKILCILQYLLG